jgi:cobalt/nickel transport system permease protein
MHVIDQYAYSNHIRLIEPAQKAGLAVLVMLLCLILNRPAVGFIAMLWMWALATLVARLPWHVFGRVLLAEGLFLALSVIGVAVSAGSIPPADAIGALAIGPVWFGVSQAGLVTALTMVCRALGGAAGLNFLILTTPLIDLIDLARRLRVPPLLIDLMTLIYRSIFVLLESLQRMYIAQDSRLGYRTMRQAMHSAGLLGSQLFIYAYRRAQRLQTALESRSYSGDLQVLPITYRHDWSWYGLSALVIASLILARVLL